MHQDQTGGSKLVMNFCGSEVREREAMNCHEALFKTNDIYPRKGKDSRDCCFQVFGKPVGRQNRPIQRSTYERNLNRRQDALRGSRSCQFPRPISWIKWNKKWKLHYWCPFPFRSKASCFSSWLYGCPLLPDGDWFHEAQGYHSPEMLKSLI